MRLSDAELAGLVASGESHRVEFKATYEKSVRDVVRMAICAFANDLPDGRAPGIVVLGLGDDGVPSGLTVDDALLQMLTGIRTEGLIVPPPAMHVETRSFRNHDVAVVTVLPSDSPPVRYKGQIHVRAGPRRGFATAQEERVLNEKRRYKTVPFDIYPVDRAHLSDLNLRWFEDEYLPNALSPKALSENTRPVEQRLASAKMVTADQPPVPTILGLLTMGKRSRDFVPGNYVQFLRIHGVEYFEPVVDAEEIDGTIFEILDRLDDKMRAHNRTSVDFVTEDRERRQSTYPLAALRQITRNAVMHRAYEGTHAPVRVTWFDDRIEMSSPGGPFGNVSVENFGQGSTDYRNPDLAEGMKVMGYVQKFGVGIPTARRLMAEAGHDDLKFQVDASYVNVTIPGLVG